MIAGHTQKLTGTTLRNFTVDSSSAFDKQVKTGSGHGIVIASDNYIVEGLKVSFCEKDAYHYGLDLMEPAVQTTVAQASNGLALKQTSNGLDTISVGSTTGFDNSGMFLIVKSSGQAAYMRYGSKTATSFVDCKSNWNGGKTVFTLSTGDKIIPTYMIYNGTTINTLAYGNAGHGYYVDWHFNACEWGFCRVNGGAVRPTSAVAQDSSTRNGFMVHASSCTFNTCHSYYVSGNGLQMGDYYSFAAENIAVLGGTWENNALSGIRVMNNTSTCSIVAASIYENGTATGQGSDVFLGSTARMVKIQNCNFKPRATTSTVWANKMIYVQGSTDCVIENCHIDSGYMASFNIYVDGTVAESSYLTIRNNKVRNKNGGAVFVQFKGNVSNCLVADNVTDSPIEESAYNAYTPGSNIYRDNVLVPGFNAGITTIANNGSRIVTRGLGNLSYTTATRPAASATLKGENIFDTTLNKPLWSDGTNWRDATGSVV